MAKIFRKIS
jgi:hypothetical protein